MTRNMLQSLASRLVCQHMMCKPPRETLFSQSLFRYRAYTSTVSSLTELLPSEAVCLAVLPNYLW
jgi:hypothetical protein